ncbi:amino acid ABC transporter permease [Paenibacillus mucilaginosus]|uniref:Polar amino acid ABC transporter permease n=3 Tax=Paenibacillus mucilaginosus TaxID=61624 RepID=H6NPV5_9BACL|nr:amino acid ABC transporter permease [Paenibacillus mucilaginosus]AEI43504.1 polar amino acid ABC transporter, inner membrane subunit [Paenibacillus mucilaginosus KNP414]AFC31146.1 polar amino acid ABC transporter permease [Paenibacillus mucilaginosus 3016]AFH63468.1 cysteine ABC transporter permease [Paenibacillus mucilaginosus K02]MCG7211952.1 amino acid ABC transporter permease [Paenibacillus mucilaginosus]WDM25054.1 amino acid ABC transporter permease [Paenibacillus mucilaginosus]
MGKAFDITLVGTFLPKLLAYLHVTLFILLLSLIAGVVFGSLLALVRLYRVPVLSRAAVVYVSFMRGTPIIIQLFLVYYGLPELLRGVGIDLSSVHALVFVILTYGLHIGAFFSEIVRSAVVSVDRGQVEAAYSIGMTPKDAFLRIVLPQALTIAMPNFGNLVISSLKDTSLAFSLGVMDMSGRAETLGTTNHYLEIYMALAVIYYAVSLSLEKLFALAERRLQRHEIREGSEPGNSGTGQTVNGRRGFRFSLTRSSSQKPSSTS